MSGNSLIVALGLFIAKLSRERQVAVAVSDAELVQRSLVGEKAAFGELYDRYAALVRAICYDTTGEMAAAHDLAQEVFLRAYSKLGKLRKQERFAPWLIGIARFVCREYRRGKFRDRHVLVGLDPGELEAVRHERTDDRLEMLNAAMARLPEKERLVLRVFYLQGQDAEQARKIMNISRSSFYRLLDRAKNNLKNALDRQENQG